MINDNKTAVIIVAGGNGTRMGGVAKQLIKLNGVETICHTINAFEQCSIISEIIIVCRREDEEEIKSLVEKYGYKKITGFTYGGETRKISVENGLSVVSEDCNYVAIHDGARPLVTVSDIEKVVLNAYKTKASALGVSVKDTIKIINSKGVIENTPNRNNLIAIHTPQVFEKDLYINAVKNSEKINKEFTDDCSIVEEFGAEILVTIGSYENIKITTPEDIAIASNILKNRK